MKAMKRNKAKKPQAERALQYFLDNPGANVKGVAKRFGISLPYAYNLRNQAKTPDEEILTIELDDLLDAAGVPAILGQRAKTYGAFKDNARVAQGIKRVMAEHARERDRTFADDQWEALEMIASKISRIVNGDPDSVDQWDDIAGYATLIADRLRGVAR
jgi:hypothetical protein